jgi:hypothetical protein
MGFSVCLSATFGFNYHLLSPPSICEVPGRLNLDKALVVVSGGRGWPGHRPDSVAPDHRCVGRERDTVRARFGGTRQCPFTQTAGPNTYPWSATATRERNGYQHEVTFLKRNYAALSLEVIRCSG